MIAALLQLAFRQRAVQLGDATNRLNYVLQDHNPHTQQLTITAPQDNLASFVYLHASRKIADLNIYGGFGAARETGLVWNQPITRLFSILIEMETADGADFYIVRWAQTVVVNSCYFGVDKAVIQAKVFKALSVTDSSLVCAYILCAGVPYSQFIKNNAFFTQNRRLQSAPASYEEPCSKCAFASRGKSCNECAESTHLMGQNCVCAYRNYAYLDYYSECAGKPTIMSAVLNDTVANVAFQYFTPCEHNFAFSVNYFAKLTSNYSIQFFHDDACGINNVYLNGSIVTESTKSGVSEVAGFVFTKTTSMSNVTLNLTVVNSNQKLFALTAFARNATGSIVFENFLFQGNATELGAERNILSSFRINVLFHTLQNVSLTLKNVTMPACSVKSFSDGTYNAIGIGIAIVCNISAYDLYIGDFKKDFKNPVLGYNFESKDEPQGNCTDKMSRETREEALFRDKMPAQLNTGRTHTYVDCNSSNQAGLIGLLQNSKLVLNRSLIAVRFQTYYLASKAGILVMDVDSSTVSVQFTALHGFIKVVATSGAIGRVSSAYSQLSVRASLNMTTSSDNSGFFGIVEGGLIQLQVLLNVIFSNYSTGGLVGWLDGGSVAVLGAFGYVKTNGSRSNPEVGYWTNGQFDNDVCQNSECKVVETPNSYINTPNVDGICGPKVIPTEPISSGNNMYFAPCAKGQKIKIYYVGKLDAANLTIFSIESACELVNVNVTGTLAVGSSKTMSYSVVLRTTTDSQNVYIDTNVSHTSSSFYRLALMVQEHAGGAIRDVIIKGSLIAVGSASYGHVSGCIAYATGSVDIENLALYGVTVNVRGATAVSLIVAQQMRFGNYRNIVIDDYQKTKKVPNLGNLNTLPDDFKCAKKV